MTTETTKTQFEAGKTYAYSTYFDEYTGDYRTEKCECVKRTKCFVWLKSERDGEIYKRKIQSWDKRRECCDAPGYHGDLYAVYATQDEEEVEEAAETTEDAAEEVVEEVAETEEAPEAKSFTIPGYFGEGEAETIENMLNDKSFYSWHVTHSNMAGNCTIIVESDYPETVEELKAAFMHHVLAELAFASDCAGLDQITRTDDKALDAIEAEISADTETWEFVDEAYTEYQVQVVQFAEFERNDFGGLPEVHAIFQGTEDQCLRYWNSYCSGACDEYPHDGQNKSEAKFYRIVEIS